MQLLNARYIRNYFPMWMVMDAAVLKRYCARTSVDSASIRNGHECRKMAVTHSDIDRCRESMAASVYDNWSRPIEFTSDPGISRTVYDLTFDIVSSCSCDRRPNVRLFFSQVTKCIDCFDQWNVCPVLKVLDQVVDLSVNTGVLSKRITGILRDSSLS